MLMNSHRNSCVVLAHVNGRIDVLQTCNLQNRLYLTAEPLGTRVHHYMDAHL